MDRTTLTANLRPLERRGLLKVSVDPDDRRRRAIALTPAGRKLLGVAVPVWKGVNYPYDFKLRFRMRAAGLVIVALAVTTRGLVPEPEARTRIGEVPSVGRSLVQQAIIPPALIERRSVDAEIGPVGELRRTRDSSGSAAEDALTIGSAVDGSMSASQLAASAGSRGGAPQSGGGEDIAKLSETPDRAPPQDTALAQPATEQMLDREVPGSAQAAPATVPVAAPAPTEPGRDDEMTRPRRLDPRPALLSCCSWRLRCRRSPRLGRRHLPAWTNWRKRQSRPGRAQWLSVRSRKPVEPTKPSRTPRATSNDYQAFLRTRQLRTDRVRRASGQPAMPHSVAAR